MIQLSLLCSFDSFLAAAGLSLAGCPNHYRRRLIIGFATCDALASFAGARLHLEIPAAAIALALAAALTILFAARKTPALYLLIPVLLCVDNLASGAPAPSALLGGLCSGLAASAGFLIGNRVLRGLPQTAAWLAGAAALSVALLA
jgi:hypothetical protein